ncbi:stage II sporulation protein R [Halobacillus sp. K22]|uniref:stage II sporulation protein R n=1 Tax=Halobacillus sp. K22 TaxID=3457431 RepID=UPI003FCCA8F2
MKNSLHLLLALSIIIVVLPWGQSTGAEWEQYQVIPDEAIRLRILADSNNENDQQVKRLVRDEVNQEINKWVKDITSIEEARNLIQDSLPEIEKVVAETLKREGINYPFEVDYNDSVKFPTKLYGTYMYPAGEYEAILITLGKGTGDNWWCVLFPPLCFLDFSNGTSVAQAEETNTNKIEAEPAEDEKEVKFFVVKLWDKLFS